MLLPGPKLAVLRRILESNDDDLKIDEHNIPVPEEPTDRAGIVSIWLLAAMVTVCCCCLVFGLCCRRRDAEKEVLHIYPGFEEPTRKLVTFWRPIDESVDKVETSFTGFTEPVKASTMANPHAPSSFNLMQGAQGKAVWEGGHLHGNQGHGNQGHGNHGEGAHLSHWDVHTPAATVMNGSRVIASGAYNPLTFKQRQRSGDSGSGSGSNGPSPINWDNDDARDADWRGGSTEPATAHSGEAAAMGHSVQPPHARVEGVSTYNRGVEGVSPDYPYWMASQSQILT